MMNYLAAPQKAPPAINETYSQEHKTTANSGRTQNFTNNFTQMLNAL